MSDREQHNSSLFTALACRASAVERGLDQDRRSTHGIVAGKGGKGPGRAMMMLAFICCLGSKASAWLSVTHELI